MFSLTLGRLRKLERIAKFVEVEEGHMEWTSNSSFMIFGYETPIIVQRFEEGEKYDMSRCVVYGAKYKERVGFLMVLYIGEERLIYVFDNVRLADLEDNGEEGVRAGKRIALYADSPERWKRAMLELEGAP